MQASKVYVADSVKKRPQKAKELGATPVDFGGGDP